jgi:hypothetical protein
MSRNQIIKPNFFILGAGKSGSTSLYWHLKKHPDIFLTRIKEPTFFSEGFQVVKSPNRYFELYDAVSTENIIGEASHVYLTTQSTARVLKGLFPDAKFLIILRNPADRAYSLYHHMRRHGFEYINTFEKALEAEEVRFTSKKFLDECPQYFYNYLYFRSSLYGEQIKNYFSIFPQKKQFHIIKFEEFITDPNGYFNRIFQFLGVNPDVDIEFEVRNTGKVTARFPLIHFFVNTRINKPLALRNVLLNLLKQIKPMKIPPMRQETRNFLLDRYTDDLKLLYELTGISFFGGR